MGDDVGDPYTCVKFYHDPISGFCSPTSPLPALAGAYEVTYE